MLGIALLVVAATAPGCECGGGPIRMNDASPDCGGQCLPASPPGTPQGQACCMMTNMCVDYDVNSMCMPGFTCPVANIMLDASCNVSCSMCVELPPLPQGFLAQDLDFVVDSHGAQFLSGWDPGLPTTLTYEDLVFGTVPTAGAAMTSWEIIDGVPRGPVTGSVHGWRQGVSGAGDDVGRWSSMAVNNNGTFYIAYYDATHGALKLAIGQHGMWQTQTVDAMGNAGRYASLVLTSTGAPAIAYLGWDAPDMMGQVHSGVRVAIAHSAMPAAAADWTITHVSNGQSPCRPFLCSMTQQCTNPSAPMMGVCATAGAGCTPACATGQACVGGTCVATLPHPYIEDIPPARGMYVSLAVTQTGLALIYYDRVEGNLYGAASTGMTWGMPFLIDGYGRMDPNTGDTGIGASLYIDRNDIWHVTYIDGAEENLHYTEVTPGSPPSVAVREIIDDGSTSDGTMPNMDGRHIIGDDSSVIVLLSGEVRVAYQDNTAERTMIARRMPGATTWTHSVLDSMKHNGFWVEQETDGMDSWVASWWLDRTGMMVTNGVHITQVH